MSDERTVHFFYDYSCPWSFIAFVRLIDVATRNRARIVYRPVSVDRILATENPQLRESRFAANPAKAAWQQKDLGDWAHFWGLPMELPAGWPSNPLPALLGGVVAAELGAAEAYSQALFRAYFGGGADISDTPTVIKLAELADLDVAVFKGQLEAEKTVAALDKNIDDLLQHGGFGTPTFMLDESLYFGNDRLPLVEWMLGPAGQDDFVMPGQHDQI